MSDDLDAVIPATLDGVRVDRAVATLTALSRGAVQALVRDGAVALNGRVVTKGSLTVTVGDHLVARVPDETPALVAEPTLVVDELVHDDAFLVVNKPAGLLVHPGAGHRHGTLIEGLLGRYPELASLGTVEHGDPFRPGVVHRLDKGTSGTLVVARTEEGFRELRRQVQHHQMEREYTSLVEGHVTADRGVIDAPLGPDDRDPTARAVRADGKWARTHYEVRARLTAPRPLTLLALRLETGRTHQIRVHVAAIDHPVVNDRRYGHRRDERLAPDRPFLHASRLRFEHPITREPVEAIAPLPADLAALLEEPTV